MHRSSPSASGPRPSFSRSTLPSNACRAASGRRMSSATWASQSPPMDEPSVAFDRIFADVGGEVRRFSRVNGRARTSVPQTRSARGTQLSAMPSPLVTSKKSRRTCRLLRDIESRVGGDRRRQRHCSKPARPTLTASPDVIYNPSGMETANPAADVDTPQRNELARNLLVSSLACDLTRVGTIMMAPSRSDIFMSWLNINASHHDLSHDPDSNTVSQQRLVQITSGTRDRLPASSPRSRASKREAAPCSTTPSSSGPTSSAVGNNHSHLAAPADDSPAVAVISKPAKPSPCRPARLTPPFCCRSATRWG